MPRSSRHKSHKVSSKHRDHSESDEDSKKIVKERGLKDESSVRASKELSVIAEKRKVDSKDLSSYRNGDVLDEFVGSKRRKDRGEVGSGGGGDRWNGGGDERGDVVVVEKEEGKGELKSKSLNESKSKPSRRHDLNEKKEDHGLVKEKDESKSERNESKLKIVNDRMEKEKVGRDSSRKEISQYKDLKEKERGLERDRKVQDSKRGVEPRSADVEAKRKHASQLVDDVVEVKVERTSNTVRSSKDELQNQELEKEVEKRIRRKGDDDTSEKEKYQDEKREGDDRHLQLRVERDKDGRYKDARYKDDRYKEEKNTDRTYKEERNTDRTYKEERNTDRSYKEERITDRSYKEERNTDRSYKEERNTDQSYKEERNVDRSYKEERNNDRSYKEERNIDRSYKEERNIDRSYKEDRNKDGSYRDKYRDDVDNGSRHRDGKQKGDAEREKKQLVDKYRDEHSSRDRPVDKSDLKRLRDGIDAENRNKKSRTEINDRDGSPIYDDRGTRYKDDKGNRRYDDKEYTTDLRSRSYKEQRPDLEKRSASSGKAEPIADRERQRPRYIDTESSMNHSRRRGSPISNPVADKDQYRYSKTLESIHRDVVQQGAQLYESHVEVVGGCDLPQKASAPKSSEKPNLKDDDRMGRLSAERRIVETRNSPMQLNEKSPSSFPNRGGVRRSIDVEDSGQRSGGSKDLKDYSGNDGKRSKDLPIDSYSVNEHAQTDGENMSVSSPFVRTNYSQQPGHSKSLLPPPSPFRNGVDNSSAFGSYEDDGRGMRNNRFKRIGDSNMNRVQPNSWKGVPSWPSPMANGFIHPFPHGPPPVGFHPVMQQFSNSAMYGVRPPMDINHQAVPYHIPDAERYANHVRPFEGWGPSNGMDASRMYGMVDWDHNRAMNNGAWDTSVDMWNRQDTGMAKKLAPIPPQVEKTSNTLEEALYDPFNQAADNERSQLDVEATENGTNNSADDVLKDSFEAPIAIPEKAPKVSKISRDENAYSAHIYLSKLYLSDSLISTELYNECTVLMHGKQEAIVDVDVQGITKARVKMFNHVSNGSLFAAIDDSILKRAMSLYKKQKEETIATTPKVNGVKVMSPIDTYDGAFVPEPVTLMDTDNQIMPITTSATPEAESSFPTPNPDSEEKEENKGQETALVPPKLEESLTDQNDKEDDKSIFAVMPEETEDEPNAAIIKEVKMEVDMLDEEIAANAEDKLFIVPSNVQPSTENTEGANMVIDDNDSIVKIKEEKLDETMCDPACEAVMMTEFNDLESSVNLRRIHHLPESTH